jgi:aminopeptidase YwaD
MERPFMTFGVARERIYEHVARIAEKPRPEGSPALAAARDYAEGCLTSAGWIVSRHPFSGLSPWNMRLSGINLVAQHPAHPWSNRGRICLGAHIDSHENSPGADDNASALAALFEIARVLPALWPAQARLDLELVVFDLEEYGMLGAADRAAHFGNEKINLSGMVSLEMLGYRALDPRSQALPRSLAGKYPDTGNWIAVIGNQNSTALIAAWRDGMRRVPGLPVETLQVPENGNLLQATRLSDHSPFWDAGYPALMITDTAFLRNPHYHLPSDTIETLDFDFLHEVAQGCLEAVCELLRGH